MWQPIFREESNVMNARKNLRRALCLALTVIMLASVCVSKGSSRAAAQSDITAGVGTAGLDIGILDAANGTTHSTMFNGYTPEIGIDVSYAQTTIDWAKVKSAGVKFAFIRASASGWGTGKQFTDSRFLENLKGAASAGLDIGVYHYSQAVTTAEAVAEANYIVNLVKNSGYSKYVNLPIVIDYEYAEEGGKFVGRIYEAFYASLNSGDASKKTTARNTITNIVSSFCATVKANGFNAMLYANKDFLTNGLDAASVASQYSIWLAQYNAADTYAGAHSYWQYTSSGKVSGINGFVDMDYRYVAGGPKLTLGADGKRYYTKAGVTDTSYTGLFKYDNSWWYIKNGVVDTTFVGLVKYSYSWWYVENGHLQSSRSGLIKHNNAWWYVEKGKWIKSYTGLVKYNNAWWYVKNGRLDRSYAGLVKYNNAWWYVKNGRLDRGYAGLVRYNNALWYVKNGRLDRGYSGTAKLDNVWYRVKNGRVSGRA